jgi:hypothetical protein
LRARRGLRGRRGELGGRVLLGHRLLEIGELELELLDQPGAALGGLAEPLAPHPGEQQLEALDLQPGAGHLGLDDARPLLGGEAGRALGEDHRVRSGEVVGERVRAVHEADSST